MKAFVLDLLDKEYSSRPTVSKDDSFWCNVFSKYRSKEVMFRLTYSMFWLSFSQACLREMVKMVALKSSKTQNPSKRTVKQTMDLQQTRQLTENRQKLYNFSKRRVL